MRNTVICASFTLVLGLVLIFSAPPIWGAPSNRGSGPPRPFDPSAPRAMGTPRDVQGEAARVAAAGALPAHARPEQVRAGAWSTAYTLFLGNGTRLPGDVFIPQIGSPEFAAYDPDNGMVYVSSSRGYIFEVDPATLAVDRVLTNVPAGNLVYLSSTHDLYVESYGNLTVLDPVTDQVISNILVPQASLSTDGTLVYVPGSNAFVVGSEYDTAVGVVSLTTGKEIANVTAGTGVANIMDGSYDPVNHEVYLASWGGNEVLGLDPATWTITQTFLMNGTYGMEVSAVLADPTSGDLFVSNLFLGWGCGGTDYLLKLSSAAGTVLGSLSVGSFTSGMALDPSSGDLVLADACSESAYTIDPSNMTLVHTTSIGGPAGFLRGQEWPIDLPVQGRVLVLEGYSQTIAEVDPSSGTVPLARPTNDQPDVMAADPECGCLLVGDTYLNRIDFVDEQTLQVRTSETLVSPPRQIIYDPNLHEVLVLCNNVAGSVILTLNASTGSLVADLPFRDFVDDLALDPSNGHLFLGAQMASSLVVLQDSNLTELANVPVPPFPLYVALAPNVQQVYFTTGSATNVSRVDTVTDRPMSNVTLGCGPNGVYADPEDGDLYLPCGGGVVVLDPQTGSSVGSIGASNVLGISSDPTNGQVYLTNGTDQVAVAGTPAGPVASVSVGNDTVATSPFPQGFFAGDPESGAIYEVINGTTSSGAPTISSFSAVPSTFSLGDQTSFQADVVGGTLPLTAMYVGLPAGCSAPDALAFSCTPTVTGNFTVVLTVTDASGRTATASASLAIGPPASLLSVALNPTVAVVEIGHTVSFNATTTCSVSPCPSTLTLGWSVNNTLGTLRSTSGGTGTYQSYTGTQGGAVLLSVAATLGNVERFANASIQVVATPVSVLSGVSISPSTGSVVVGGSITLQAVATCSGGAACPSSGLLFVWSVDRGGSLSSSGASTVFTATASTGVASVSVLLTLNDVSKRAWANLSLGPGIAGHSWMSPLLPLAAVAGVLIVLVVVVVAVAVSRLRARRKGRRNVEKSTEEEHAASPSSARAAAPGTAATDPASSPSTDTAGSSEEPPPKGTDSTSSDPVS